MSEPDSTDVVDKALETAPEVHGVESETDLPDEADEASAPFVEGDQGHVAEDSAGAAEADRDAPGAPMEPDEEDVWPQRLAELVEVFDRRSEMHEATIRSLTETVENLQQNQVKGLLKPVFERLASLHAVAIKAVRDAADRGEAASAEFEYFTDVIEEIFGFFDMDSVEAAPGVPLNPRLHSAVRAVPTSDAEQDRLIHQVMRQGFKHAVDDRASVVARVTVHRYEPGAATKTVGSTCDS